MLRRLIPAAALCLLAALGPAHALGLGEIKVASKLNQRFSAVIPFTSLSADEAANVRVRLADNRAFARAGVDRSAYLSSVEIEAVTEGGNPRIVLRSGELAREPLLNLMIEVSTPGGPRILREYTVFLDPAVSAPTPAPVAKPQALPDQAVAASRKDEFFQTADENRGAATSSSSSPAASGDPSRYTVRAGQTLSTVAQAVKSAGVSQEQAILALYEANPGAFTNGDINNLRKGVTLKVPNAEQMRNTSSSAARARIGALSSQNSVAAATNAPAVTPQPDPVMSTEPMAPAVTPSTSTGIPAAAPATSAAQDGTPPSAGTGEVAPNGEVVPPVAAEAPIVAPVTPEAAVDAPATAVDSTTASPTEESSDKGLLGMVIPVLIGLVVLLIAIAAFRAIRERRAQREYEDAARSTASLPVARLGAKGSAAAKKSARAELEELDRNIEGGADVDATRLTQPDDDRTSLDPDTTGPYPRYGGDAPVPRKLDKAEMEVTSQFAANTTQIDLGDNDPLSEADFHLAYGLYDEAALMLQQAAARDPGRTELKVKLAETYFAAGKPREFEQIAELLKGKVDAEAWGKIAIMGRQLCTDSSLFADTSGASEMALDMSFDEDATIAPVAVDKGLEFSLDELELPTQTGKSGMAKDNSTLEFDLGEFDLGGADVKPTKLQATNEINLKDFDLGGSELAGPGKSHLDVRLDEIDPLVLDDPSDGDTLSSGDDAGTKLDLARAYVEMGDAKMARSLLEEVEVSGTADQKREAASLRERLLG